MVEQAAKPLARPVWVLDATLGKVRAGRDGDDHPAELIIFLKALPNQVTSKMEVISGLMREGFLNELAQWVVTNLRKTNPFDSSSSAYSWIFDLDGIAQMYQSYEETNLWCYKHEFLKDFFLSTGLLFQYEAELDAFLEFLIWRFSIWVHKPTLGYALMNLRYGDELTMETRAKRYAHGNMDLLKDQDVIRIVLNLLKTNTSVVTGLGTNWIVICAPDDGSCVWGYFDVCKDDVATVSPTGQDENLLSPIMAPFHSSQLSRFTDGNEVKRDFSDLSWVGNVTGLIAKSAIFFLF
ncbi:unnamed protein product [Lactuca saligna]|uniref:RING-type E3 ubiquitin transferase (cysteine targeting) n=1 Tax=Lactuca saligna TaxID=75948 RepID=A0AA35Z3S2_LACSI|nr:unnamed protein product [Lactuca saligna]